LRFFFHIDPEALSDEDWLSKVAEMEWVLEATGKMKRDKDGKITFYN